jgi:hypothetical protein
MNQKVPALIALGLAACSMQALAAPPTAPAVVTPPAPPPMVFRTYGMQYAAPIPSVPADLPPPRICLLGSDCMAMDSHPFETCLVSTTRCGDKLAEVMQVQKPKILVKPAPPVEKTSR